MAASVSYIVSSSNSVCSVVIYNYIYIYSLHRNTEFTYCNSLYKISTETQNIYRRTDGQTDGRTDGHGESSIPPHHLQWAGGIINNGTFFAKNNHITRRTTMVSYQMFSITLVISRKIFRYIRQNSFAMLCTNAGCLPPCNCNHPY